MSAAASRDASGNTLCPDCGGNRFVEDRAAGDVVCYNCGLVVEAHLIDERSEWRTFSDKDKEGTDPNRVGGPTNPLLEGGGLSTIIGKGRDGDNSYMLNRLHTRSNNPDRALISAFKKMGEICESMQMSSTVVRDSACEIYKMAAESGRLKGRGVMPICAACLYMACRQSNVPRTFKEITASMPAEVSKKDIGRCFQELLKLQREIAITKPNANTYLQQQAPLMKFPVDYMKRFTAELRLDFHTQKACQAMALAAKPKEESQASKLLPWDSRSPVSVAAAILFAATCIKSKPGERISLQDIYMVTNVATTTIKAVYKELYTHIEMLLPPGVSLYEALSKLPVPEGFPKPNLAKLAPPPTTTPLPSTSTPIPTPMQGAIPGALNTMPGAASISTAMPSTSGSGAATSAAMPGLGAGGVLPSSVPNPLAQASQMVQQHLAQQAQQTQRGTAGQPQAQATASSSAMMPPPLPRTLNPQQQQQQQQQLVAQQKAAAAAAAAAQQGLNPQQQQLVAQQKAATAAAAQRGLNPQQQQQQQQLVAQQKAAAAAQQLNPQQLQQLAAQQKAAAVAAAAAQKGLNPQQLNPQQLQQLKQMMLERQQQQQQQQRQQQ